jgi:hypothetical protein
MKFTSAGMKIPALCGMLALVSGCAAMGITTSVADLGNGRYKIVTSQADDVAKANAAAARDKCPGGYTLLQKGSTAQSLYGSVIRGADLGTFWVVKCVGTP